MSMAQASARPAASALARCFYKARDEPAIAEDDLPRAHEERNLAFSYIAHMGYHWIGGRGRHLRRRSFRRMRNGCQGGYGRQQAKRCRAY